MYSSVTSLRQEQPLKFMMAITELFLRAFCTLVFLLKSKPDIYKSCRFMLRPAFKQKTIHSERMGWSLG